MANVFDVATYILELKGPMTAMKLQKLVYYSQAWALVWNDKPLFSEEIQAWANGPVVPDLYQLHKGQLHVVSLSEGSSTNLDDKEKETINTVINYYGDKTSHWLSELTHKEQPWIVARNGCLAGEFCANEITQASMAEYYGSL